MIDVNDIYVDRPPESKLYLSQVIISINAFHATGLFLYPLKTSGRYRRYRKRPVA